MIVINCVEPKWDWKTIYEAHSYVRVAFYIYLSHNSLFSFSYCASLSIWCFVRYSARNTLQLIFVHCNALCFVIFALYRKSLVL